MIKDISICVKNVREICVKSIGWKTRNPPIVNVVGMMS